jgi:hypothetical protein
MLVPINIREKVIIMRSEWHLFYLPDDVSVDRLFDVDDDRALVGGWQVSQYHSPSGISLRGGIAQ